MRVWLTATIVCLSVFLICPAMFGKAMDLGRKAPSTPYDRHMGEVKRVIDRVSEHDSKISRVRTLLAIARRFRHRDNPSYAPKSPALTESARSGDCKDKSLWLIAQMGSDNARFVIGKLKANSRVFHSWVYWQYKGQWYILDPSFHTRPIPVSHIRHKKYIPYYSYSEQGVYVHDSTRLTSEGNRQLHGISQSTGVRSHSAYRQRQ